MTTVKTLVATGTSSGIGFEVIKQLLLQKQPWNFILGVRNITQVQAAFDGLQYDTTKHNLTLLPLDLTYMRNIKPFVQQTLQKLGDTKIDYLLLNAGLAKGTETKGPHSKWCESYIVNHLSQHYLVHLFENKLVESKSRIIFVSSGAIRNVKDTSTLEIISREASGADMASVYSTTKFIQLLGAHWWNRRLKENTVVAVSPGFVPNTGLGRHAGKKMDTTSIPDAISVPQSGENVLRAFTRNDFPEDPEQIFLTSWGEWWPKDVYELTLDKDLQGKWCLGKEEIEREEGIVN